MSALDEFKKGADSDKLPTYHSFKCGFVGHDDVSPTQRQRFAGCEPFFFKMQAKF